MTQLFCQLIVFYKTIKFNEVVVAHGHNGVTVMRRLRARSPLGGMNDYLFIFSLLRSGTKIKSPALSSQKIRRKVGNGVF